MSKFQPKVSIVIPVYNGANYLRQAIESALAQDYPNFEILVVNDGSTDNGRTREIALQFGDQIRYFEQNNGGVGSALNLAIKELSGEFFSWLSHDDLYVPTKISRQIKELEQLPENSRKTTTVYSEWKSIDKDGFPVAESELKNLFPIEKLNVPLYPLFKALLHGCTLLIPTHLLRSVGGFDVSLPTTQDYDCWLKVLRRAEIRLVPEFLVLARIHEEQGSKKITGHRQESDILWERMFASLSPEECMAMEGSARIFWAKAQVFCLNQRFDRAHRFVLNQLTNVVAGPAGVRLVYGKEKPSLQQIIHSLKSVGQLTVFLEHLPLLEQTKLQEELSDLKLIFAASDAMAKQIRLNGIEYLFYLEAGHVFEPNKVTDQIQVAETSGMAWTLSSAILHYGDGSLKLCTASPVITDPSFWTSNFMVSLADGQVPDPDELREYSKLRPGLFLPKPLTQMLDQPTPMTVPVVKQSPFRRLAVRCYKRSGAVYVHHWGRAWLSRRRRQAIWRSPQNI